MPPVGLFLPGPGPWNARRKGENLPLTAYETAVEALGPAATWRLQDPDPGAQIPFLDDQFTGTDGTLLSAHSTDSGHSWTKHPTLADTSEIKTNRLCYTTGGAGDSVYYSSDVPSSADYTVESMIRCVSNAFTGAGVYVRLDTTAHTGYRLLHLGVANNWYLQKMVAGSPTTLASGFLEVLAPGDVRVMQLRAEGSMLTALVDGVVIYQVVDTSITAAGRPGVYEGTGGTPTAGYHTDYVQAFKTAPIVDSTANAHNGTAIGNFTLGQDGFAPGEGALATEKSPEQGYVRMPGYQPFVASTNRTFVGLVRVDAVTDEGPQMLFGSRGQIDGAAQPIVVMEAVYEPDDAGYTRVHYTSDLDTMTVFGISQWFSSLPRSGWYMWALTVVDNGTSQALELFVNGVSRGTGTTTQPEWAAGAGDYLLGMRGEGGREASPFHALNGVHGLQAVYDRVLTGGEILGLAQVFGQVTTPIPLDPSTAQSSATLAVSVPSSGVNVTLQSAAAQSAATLALSAPTRVVLATTATQSAATLALSAPARVTLQTSPAQSAATLSLAAPTRVVLGTAAAQSAATLALSAPTQVPLQTSAAVSSATLAVSIPSAAAEVPLQTSAAQSSATLALSAPTRVTLQSAAATSSATLGVTAPTRVTLGTAAAQSAATLALSAPTRVVLGSAAAASTATLALTAVARVTLGTAAAQSTATLVLTATTRVPLGTSVATSSATIVLTAGGSTVPLATAAAQSAATLALRAATRVVLQSAAALSTGTLLVSRPQRVTLGSAAAVSSATLTVSIPGATPATFNPTGGDVDEVRTGGDIITPDAIPLGLYPPTYPSSSTYPAVSTPYDGQPLGGTYDEVLTGGIPVTHQTGGLPISHQTSGVYDETLTGGEPDDTTGGNPDQVSTGGDVNVVLTGGVVNEVRTGGTYDEVLTGGDVNENPTGDSPDESQRSGDYDLVLTGGEVL